MVPILDVDSSTHIGECILKVLRLEHNWASAMHVIFAHNALSSQVVKAAMIVRFTRFEPPAREFWIIAIQRILVAS